MSEEIAAIRAFTIPKKPKSRRSEKKEPQKTTFDKIFVLDNETGTDLRQSQKFGYFEIYQYGKLDHMGLFYDPKNVTLKEKTILQSYCKQNKIQPYTIDKFREIFLDEIYNLETLCVGFNLPFDLTRIAIKSTVGRNRRKNGFSLQLSKNTHYPRLYVTHATSTLSFIEWGKVWPGLKSVKGNFVDLRTLLHALTNQKHTLESACKHYNTKHQKQKIKQHGRITPKYIQYCISDVKATHSVFIEAKKDFDSYNLSVPVTQAYTPASIGKEFLKAMGVKSFLKKNKKFSKDILGYIMTSYIGGRTEDKIRKIPTKVDVLDFLSMYPTVCKLQDLWRFVIAQKIECHESTLEVTEFIDKFTLEDIQNPKNWTKLPGIVLVEPNEDVLPLRAKYGEENVWNIGTSHVTSRKPLWYSIADVLASKLYTGKTPKILRAIRFVPVGVQRGLKTIDIHGIKINPYKQDLFQELVQYRQKLKDENDPREHVVKIIVNAISYGIFVQIDTDDESKPVPVDVYGLDHFTQDKTKIESFGYMFNPIIATSITSASRLLLAATEILLAKHGKTHAYCDTDSMMVPPRYTKMIQKFFQPLNPYNFESDIFKRVYDRTKWFYGISSKRYCLYDIINGRPVISDDEYSAHGLGHLLDPFSSDPDEKNNLHKIIWQDILDLHYGLVTYDQLREKYENKYAISKLAISSPHIIKRFKEFNKKKEYRDQIKPSNFCLVGYPTGINEKTGDFVKPLAPYRKPVREAVYHDFIDYNDKLGTKMRGKEHWQSLWDVFRQYLNHQESKFEGKTGVLKRKHVTVSNVVHIGKESNNLDESEVLGVDSDSYEVYEKIEDLDEKFKKISEKVLKLNPRDVKKFGISRQTLWNIKKNICRQQFQKISSRIKNIIVKVN
ncbi:MAG: DNA polymerase [Nitrososphaera sp.]|jgi:hypothetical protein